MKILTLTAISFLLLFSQAVLAQNKILVVKFDDVITKATLEIFEEGLKEAKRLDTHAVVIILDTPGGGLEETLKIMKAIQISETPVIGYVYPEGATAWSAGTFILLSTHLAAMAPHTIIGSAQPVQSTPEGVSPITEPKIINALIAVIRENAIARERNETAAIKFVTENLNLNAEDAKSSNVIEFVSPSIEQLVNDIDGIEIKTTKNLVLQTKDAEIVEFQLSLRLQFLKIIANPLLASLFLIIGVYALIFGISSPGYGSEIAGMILLALGLIGLWFQINLIALLLITTGVILVLIEVNTPGFGAVGIGGVIALIIGSILLAPIGFPKYWISPQLKNQIIVLVTVPSILIGAFLVFALTKVAQLRSKKSAVGGLIGETAVATENFGDKKLGYVRYQGEYWKAKAKQKIKKNESVRITGKLKEVLVVEKMD